MTYQYAEIGNLKLESGKTRDKVRISYNALGQLSPSRDNAILALHGYTNGPDMIMLGGLAAEGAWDDVVGPGKPVDTERYFVICPNALGSTYGSTGFASINAATGKPYGSSFPSVTIRDVVASQHALIKQLGIKELVAVIGPSFGGVQALQWAVSYPDAMRGVVALLTSVGRPPANVERVQAGLAKDPNWNRGDYYEHGNLVETLTAIRIETLKGYGVDTALSRTISDPAERAAAIARRARQWAEDFDANALLVIMKILASYDITADLRKIRARVLYVLSRTDHLFPPTLAPDAMQRFREAGVDAEYFEIDSENGHTAASTDSALWTPVLREIHEIAVEPRRRVHCFAAAPHQPNEPAPQSRSQQYWRARCNGSYLRQGGRKNHVEGEGSTTPSLEGSLSARALGVNVVVSGACCSPPPRPYVLHHTQASSGLTWM
jgi:homoserine O-acetyltransferase